MRGKIALIMVLLAMSAVALLGAMQSATVYRLLMWTPTIGYVWPVLGKSFAIEGNTVEVLFPPTGPLRKRNVVLPWQQIAGGYKFPAAPKNQECHVNGLLYTPGDDYTITGDTLVPGALGNWPPAAEAKVVCSYDP